MSNYSVDLYKFEVVFKLVYIIELEFKPVYIIVVTMTQINNAGMWFLSYLSEIGIIQHHEAIEKNMIEGRLLKDFFELSAGTYILIEMKNDGKTIYIIYANSDLVHKDYGELIPLVNLNGSDSQNDEQLENKSESESSVSESEENIIVCDEPLWYEKSYTTYKIMEFEMLFKEIK